MNERAQAKALERTYKRTSSLTEKNVCRFSGRLVFLSVDFCLEVFSKPQIRFKGKAQVD
jgi:hypothetical protein